MDLEIGKAHDVSHHKVGVTNVYEMGGTKLVTLSVLEPTSRRETQHRMQVGDTLTLGDDKYKVTAITLPSGQGTRKEVKGSITIQKL